MKQAGCVVNYNIAIAIGKGIVLAKDRTLSKENCGSLVNHFFEELALPKGEQQQQGNLCLEVF